ncbi:RagB/SusD family nutrient uptake outer membrane protein [Chitinophaga sp. XS-30]|uniref:RagB/SusD family nutrient uptake outer membrane protein n=1 Tax=Chitinophaga sp. XS-30 TaxID=2604421 RepID=UPI0011DD676B|nr:RagB/SusD family nutrient uptake outer membrane protein [Chitinophaga sp. XS-30]QEH41638.1 RagB/SusD family nutrient uptake outer membrane protein [Chitinophaga sp. XS-30]
MIRFLTSIGVCLLLFGSCKEYLDVTPKGRLIPTQVSEFDRLLDNEEIVMSFFLDNNLGCMLAYMTDNIALSEGLANIHYKAFNHPNIDRYYGHIYRAPYKNPNVKDEFWDGGIYGTVKYFNNVIDGVTALKNAQNEAEANKVLAQAYAGRAWVYLHAALAYGPVYQPGASNDTRTVPYVTSADISTPVPDLSTQQEMFRRIGEDLHAALPYAPATTNYPSRPNKTATLAMLAYYHLFTQEYDSTVYYANLAWTAATAAGGPAQVLYDFNALSFSDPGNPLFSSIVSPDNKAHLPTSREMLFFRFTDNGAGSMDDSYPSEEFVALFDQDDDLRFRYFLQAAPGFQTVFGGTPYDDGERIQYYRGAYTFGNAPRFQMTAGLSYPEVLLMRAEGYARTNRPDEAIADLNTLRRYRFKTGTPELTVPGDQDEVIRLVLEERRRELPLGHVKRFMDLKRLCLDQGKPWSKAIITHTVGTTHFEATVNSPAFRLNIPNTILQFNSEWGIPLDTRPF